jgi:hypothetical protein
MSSQTTSLVGAHLSAPRRSLQLFERRDLAG